MRVTISHDDEIIANGYKTGFKVATDKDGAFLIHDDRTESESRHSSRFDVAQAFKLVFSN